jgi:hypothetical protein
MKRLKNVVFFFGYVLITKCISINKLAKDVFNFFICDYVIGCTHYLIIEIKFRCLDRVLQVPHNNPLFCHRQNPLNTTFVMECCKNEDFCNVRLSPQLMQKPQGKMCSATLQTFYFFYSNFFFTSAALFSINTPILSFLTRLQSLLL